MKPKQQTKQQLMERCDALWKTNGTLSDEIMKLREENFRLEADKIDKKLKADNRYPLVALSVGIAALAVFLLGLYTGHKISQRGFGEKLIAAQNSEYRRGLDSGIGMGADYIKELRSHCFKATHLNRKGMTIEEIKHKFEATHLTHEGVMAHAGNPKLMKTKVIDWSIYHRQIHHVKGAERLRE